MCNEESDEFGNADEPELEQKRKIGPSKPRIVRSDIPGRLRKSCNVIQAVQSVEIPLQQIFKEAGQLTGAMDAEYKALVTNGTWTVADLPKGKQAIGCKWVYTVKRSQTGTVERYKARLVAKVCAKVRRKLQ